MEPQIGIRGRFQNEHTSRSDYPSFNGAPDRNPGKDWRSGRRNLRSMGFNGAPDRNPGKVCAQNPGVRWPAHRFNGAPDRNPGKGAPWLEGSVKTNEVSMEPQIGIRGRLAI